VGACIEVSVSAIYVSGAPYWTKHTALQAKEK
jgi:hypothetical protein